jgi:hypothetical protein
MVMAAQGLAGRATSPNADDKHPTDQQEKLDWIEKIVKQPE